MLVRNSLKRTTFVAAAVAFSAMMVLPTVAAQGSPTIAIDGVSPPANALFPEVDSGRLRVDFTYSLPTNLQSLSGLGTVGVPVNVRPNCPNTVLVEGPTQKIVAIDTTQTTTSYPDSVEFQVTLTRQAPGLQSIPCQLTVSADALFSPAINAPESDATSQFSVRADFYSLVVSNSGQKIKQAGPQKEVPFEITLTNFGNARTQIAFETQAQPEGGRWSILLPDNIILDTPNGGGANTQQIATVTISTTYKNGWNNEQGAFQLLMRPTAADQAEKIGNTISANVLVRVRGVYIPTLEPFVMVGAVLGAALVARMNREELE